MTSTVYLIATPTVKRDGATPDLTPLGAHGDVKVLLGAGIYPTFTPDKAVRLLRRGLRHFNPAKDFLAWAGGDTLGCLLAGMVLAERGVTTFRWLRYDRGYDRENNRRTDAGAVYVPIEVTMGSAGISGIHDERQIDIFHEGEPQHDGR